MPPVCHDCSKNTLIRCHGNASTKLLNVPASRTSFNSTSPVLISLGSCLSPAYAPLSFKIIVLQGQRIFLLYLCVPAATMTRYPWVLRKCLLNNPHERRVFLILYTRMLKFMEAKQPSPDLVGHRAGMQIKSSQAPTNKCCHAWILTQSC